MSIRDKALSALADQDQHDMQNRIRNQRTLQSVINRLEGFTMTTGRDGEGGPKPVWHEYVVALYDGIYFMLTHESKPVPEAAEVKVEGDIKYVKYLGLAVLCRHETAYSWQIITSLEQLGELIRHNAIADRIPIPCDEVAIGSAYLFIEELRVDNAIGTGPWSGGDKP